MTATPAVAALSRLAIDDQRLGPLQNNSRYGLSMVSSERLDSVCDSSFYSPDLPMAVVRLRRMVSASSLISVKSRCISLQPYHMA